MRLSHCFILPTSDHTGLPPTPHDFLLALIKLSCAPRGFAGCTTETFTALSSQYLDRVAPYNSTHELSGNSPSSSSV